MKRIITLPWLVLICFAGANADRILLRPPEGYAGVTINGVRYVTGQVFLHSYQDTTELKQFGFKGFEPLGSNAWHKKVKAIWPLLVDYDNLPECVQGLSYEKARSKEELYSTLKEDEEFAGRSACGVTIENYGTWYDGPVRQTAVINNYGGSSGGCYPRLGCNPYGGSENRFNSDAYYYKTRSRTLLKPTKLGATPLNRYMTRKYGAPYYYGR